LAAIQRHTQSARSTAKETLVLIDGKASCELVAAAGAAGASPGVAGGHQSHSPLPLMTIDILKDGSRPITSDAVAGVFQHRFEAQFRGVRLEADGNTNLALQYARELETWMMPTGDTRPIS